MAIAEFHAIISRLHEPSAKDRPDTNPPPRGPQYRVSGLWTAFAVLVASGASIVAAVPLLTVFKAWDDEGHMLQMLLYYIRDGGLYTRTFSEYGPFYFYAQSVFFQLLHLPLTHDMGRLVTLIYWMTSGLLAAVFVFGVSRSIFLASAAAVCATLTGQALTNEPGHPQMVVLLLLMIATCLSVPARAGQYRVRVFLLGCVGGALMFTKVNVGVFYFAGLAQTLVCMLPSGKLRSIGIGVMLIYAAAIPGLLMHDNFHNGARAYVTLATITGLSTFVCGAFMHPDRRWPARAALWPVAGFLIASILIVIATSSQGIPMGSLIWGIILNPIHHASIFFLPMYITRINLVVALVLAVGALAPGWSEYRLDRSPWQHGIRCGLGIGAIALLTSHHLIQWAAPLLPLSLSAPARSKPGTVPVFARLFITNMAMTQFLQPYPVAGSQMAIAAIPMILCAFVGIVDGIDGLRTASPKLFARACVKVPWDAMIGGAILAVFAMTSFAVNATSPLPPPTTGLKGSSWLHLPVAQARDLRSIAESASANCDKLFTLPGMGSFNIWSGVPTPNGWNTGPWMRAMDLTRQMRILTILKADPQACVIVNHIVARFWDDDDAELTRLSLANYILNDMPEIIGYGDYEIRINPHRTAPWVYIGGKLQPK